MTGIEFPARGARPDDARPSAAELGFAGWLSLAAAPTFAVMALLTAVMAGGPEMLGSAAHGASPFGGMTLMYALMSAFHSSPWLRLRARRGDR